MDLELRHLKTIRAIAEEGSLTRAATALGLAQPALSAQLARIERALGGSLFARGRHGVRPTALGELVLRRARVLLPGVLELQEEAVRFAHAGTGVPGLRLGATHGPLPGSLVDRMAAEPATPVTTYASWSVRELADMVVEGRLDFALIGVCGDARPPAEDRLVWRTVGTDPVFVMLSQQHALAGRREVELADLAEAGWACVPGEGCFGDCFAAACVRAGFTPAPMYETDSASVVHLAQVGRAVGLCRAMFPPTPGMSVRPLAGHPLSWRHLIGWHPQAPAAAVAGSVLAHARAAHAEAVHRNPGYRTWLAEHSGFGTAPAAAV